MSTIANQIDILKGETKTLRVTVRNESRQFVDLTGATIYMTVKETTSSTTVLISKDSGTASEAAITVPTKGKAEIYLAAGDTDSMAIGTYVFDVWVRLAGGGDFPVIPPSPFVVKEPVSDLP